tara:strand:- start:1277 stop:2281 length:1005 start_codon:yes stop_codon:yes gene_type:complete
MDSNEGRDDGPKEDGNCVICGYHGLEEDTHLGEVVCPSCGCVNEERIIDTDGAELSRGEEPQNSPTRKLGSGAIKGKDRSARKLEETRKKVDRERSTFLSEVEELVDNTVEGERTRQEVKSLIRDLEDDVEETSIAENRKKRQGLKDLKGGERRAYRQRLYVAGAMKALNDLGRPNEAPQVAERWGINHSDLMDVSKMFKKILARRDCRDEVNEDEWMVQRAALLQYNLDKIRQFFAQTDGWEIANEVYDRAIQILKGQNEPFPPDEHCDRRIVGNFCNMVEHRAAWEAFVIAMKEMGISDSKVRVLRSSLPLSSTKNFTERRSKALSEGGEEE